MMETHGDFEWTDAKTRRLIYMFEDRPVLYDIGHEQYCNRDARNKVLEEFASEINCSGTCASNY